MGLFKKSYAEVDPVQARAAMEAGAVLVDVCEPVEWRSGQRAQGMSAWQRMGLPVVGKGGRPGRVV